MSSFEGFASLTYDIERALLRPGGHSGSSVRPSARKQFRARVDDALDGLGYSAAGYFRFRAGHDGSNWPPPSATTLSERVKRGQTSTRAMVETGELVRSITFRHDGNMSLTVGVPTSQHSPHRDGMPITLDSLVDVLARDHVAPHGSKYSGADIPGRPLFDYDYMTAREIDRLVTDFADRALFKDAQGLYNFKKR